MDVPSLISLVEHLVDGGVDGLFVLGSSSEAAFRDGRPTTAGGGDGGRPRRGGSPCWPGVIDMTTPRVLDHVAYVTAAGVDAIRGDRTLYAHPSAEIARHFRLVAARSSVPVFAYDIPVSVHTKLGAELVLSLAAEGVLSGLKDSSGDRSLPSAPSSRAPAPTPTSPASPLYRSELVVDSALALGADGAVPGLACNVDPHGYVRLDRFCRRG